jgi:hypothetical protein
MIELLLGTIVGVTAFASVSAVTNRGSLVAHRPFAAKFTHLTKGSTHTCVYCNQPVAAESTSIMFSRDGETVLLVCNELSCRLNYTLKDGKQSLVRAA